MWLLSDPWSRHQPWWQGAGGKAGLVSAKTSNLRWFRDNKQVNKTKGQELRGSRQNLSSSNVTDLCLIPYRSPSQALSCVWCLCVVSGCACRVISLTSAPHHPFHTRLELSCPLTTTQRGWQNTFRKQQPPKMTKVPDWIIVQKLGKICWHQIHFCFSCVLSDNEK